MAGMSKKAMFLTTTGAVMGAITGAAVGPKRFGLLGQVIGGAIVGAVAHNVVGRWVDGDKPS